MLAVTSTVVSGSYSPAQAALLPSLVETPDELTAANLVGNTISSVGMFAGPALGGILLAVSSPAAVFALNGALFLWSASSSSSCLGTSRRNEPNGRSSSQS